MALTQGSKGDEVTALQKALNKAGANLTVDGVYGPKTAAAVTAYQKSNGLTQDGKAGPQTLGSLGISSGDGGEGSDLNLPGNAMLWKNTETDEWIVVYTIPAIELEDGTKSEEIFVSWTVESDDDLEAIVGAGVTAVAAKSLTTAELTAMGVVNFGGVDEFRDFDHIEGDPFDSWVEDMTTLAETQPWVLDPEWHQLAVMAVLERDDAQISVAELQGTAWWQDHSESERRWLEMKHGDPATADQWVEDSRANTLERLKNAGISNIHYRVAYFMADMVTTGQWTQDKLQEQIEALSDPYSGIKLSDLLMAQMTRFEFTPDTTREKEDTVRALLNKWLGPSYGAWTDSQIAEKAGALRQDPDAQTAFVESLKDQRVAMIPGVQDRETSYQDLAGPWKTFGSNSWGQEIDETDPMFLQMLNNNDAATNGRLLAEQGLKRDVGKVVSDTRNSMKEAFGGAVY